MAAVVFLLPCVNDFVWSADPPSSAQPQRIEFKNPGVLTGETIKLESEPLPPHTSVTIKLSVRIRGSWDGEQPGDGPDALTVRLDDGRTLFNTTFSSLSTGSGEQSYPDRIRGFSHPADHGLQRLGIGDNPTYHLFCKVPHHAERLTLSINAVLNETLPENRGNASNESWELLSCEYVLSDAPPAKLDDKAFQELWDRLADEDPAHAWAAVDGLVTADPDSAMKLIRGKLDTRLSSKEKSVRDRIPKLVQMLDTGDVRARAEAVRKLSSLTLTDLPALQNAKTDDLSLEGGLGLDEIIKTIQQRSSGNDPEARRTLRLQYALDLIQKPDA